MQAFLLLCFQGLWLFSEYPATRGRRASAAEFVFTKEFHYIFYINFYFPIFFILMLYLLASNVNTRQLFEILDTVHHCQQRWRQWCNYGK